MVKIVQKILSMDEKIFTIEQKFNKQNDKVYARTSYGAKAKVLRIHCDDVGGNIVEWGYCNSFLHTRSKNDC